MKKLSYSLFIFLAMITFSAVQANETIPTTNTPIVIEFTSNWVRAGKAIDSSPSIQFRAVVGKPRPQAVMMGMPANKLLFGDEAMAKMTLLTLTNPIEEGKITNWTNWKELMKHAYSKLGVAYNAQPLLVICSTNLPTSDRTKIEQEMKGLGVASVKVVTNAEMVMKNASATTGVVLHSGAKVTTIVPVYQGQIQSNAIVNMPLGEDDLALYLMKILTERGYSYTTTKELEEARGIMETKCYIANDFDAEMQKATTSPASIETTHTRPNGTQITIGNERFRSLETLFQPAFIGMSSAGIHEATRDAINKCAANQQAALYNNIILAGENTLHTGLQARLQKDVSALTSNTVTVSNATDADLKTWKGGATYAQTATF